MESFKRVYQNRRRARQSHKGTLRVPPAEHWALEGREVARTVRAGKQRKERCEVTAIEDTVKRWCQEESLSFIAQQESDATLACAVTLPGDPPLSVAVRAPASKPGRLLVSNIVQMPLPDELAADAEATQRLTALLERVAASRSLLVECSLLPSQGELKTQIVVTLHEEGMSKQSFLAALEEVRKVERVIGWEVESMAMALGMMSEVHSRVADIAARTEALGSDAASAVAEAEAAAVLTEPPPPAVEPSQLLAETAVVAEQSDGSSDVICRNCGQLMPSDARFCRSCGANLKGE